VLLADLHQVDRPGESRLIGVRWVAAADQHAAFGIEPALEVVVHVLASHAYPFSPTSVYRKHDATCALTRPQACMNA
jgi:hypothetical protein